MAIPNPNLPRYGPSTGDALGKVSHLLHPGRKGYGYSPPAKAARHFPTPKKGFCLINDG